MSENPNDNELKWLMERSHNSYLTWIGLWLVCLLAMVNILITVASTPSFPSTPPQMTLVLSMYFGLIFGMIFSVYRVTNTLHEHIRWANNVSEKNSLRKEILDNRGALSLYIVDHKGKICQSNRSIVYAIHIIVFSILLILALTK